MNIHTPPPPAADNAKSSAFRKDAICLALVVIAVFILHFFSKSAMEQVYKTKEKSSAIITTP